MLCAVTVGRLRDGLRTVAHAVTRLGESKYASRGVLGRLERRESGVLGSLGLWMFCFGRSFGRLVSLI